MVTNVPPVPPNDGGDFFGKIMKSAMNLPFVHVDRNSFLKKEFEPYFQEETINRVIKNGPRGIVDKKLIDKIAKGCISYHTTAVCSVSALAGLPGGWAMAATIPADIAQFYGHVLSLTQKLLYLYGWPSFDEEEGEMTDDTTQILIIFMGIMLGAQGAEAAIKTLLKAFSEQVEKRLAKKALTKVGIYKVAKEICKWIGIKLTKEGFAKGVGKVVPIIGAPVSAGITYWTFRPMARKLREELDNEWKNNEIPPLA